LSFNALATQITKGATVTSIAVGTALVGNEFSTGDKVKLVNPITGQVQTFTVASAPSAGATSISVNSATANFDIPVNAGMFVQLTPQAGGGGVADGDKGDITVSSAGTVWTIDNGAVTSVKISNRAALSVMGRGANSIGTVIDIPASTDGHVLRRSGTVLGFGQIVAAGIADGSITLAKIADNAVGDSKLRQSAGFSVIGRNQSTTGNVADISTPASSGYYVLGLQNTFFGWQDKLRLKGFVNTADNEYSATNVTFNTGAGTGPTLDAIDGSYNSFYIRFTTGTSPAANSTVFKVTFPYSVSRARVTFSALTATAAAQMTNFYTSRFANQVEIYVSTALPASTQYELSFIIALG
jgi:hypothetical protein